MTETQFSTSTEVWREISVEFSRYRVSNFGRVRNEETGHILSTTRNTTGVRIVGLMMDRPDGKCIQTKKSLALLVASAFHPTSRVDDRGTERAHRDRTTFNTPIYLDGDRDNNHVNNLMLRPDWFARKYMAQDFASRGIYPHPIVDVETGERYNCSMHVAVVNGLLDTEIRLAMLNSTASWPTGQIFAPL